MAKTVVVGGAIYLIFQFWGINVTAWLASAGIIGIAIGFAAKDTLANFFAGIFILADTPYNLGDYINLDTGERGKVVHVGLRTTRLLTRDDVEVQEIGTGGFHRSDGRDQFTGWIDLDRHLAGLHIEAQAVGLRLAGHGTLLGHGHVGAVEP